MQTIKQFIKFTPILKEKIWGGEKLIKVLNKQTNSVNIGESWEISGVDEAVSVVAEGSFKGKNLQELMIEFREKLVGEKVYTQFGNKFPLLIKFIDAKTPLSIQLHPSDDLAKKRHNSFGKTEMWYVMQADKAANLIVGFKKDSNKKEYLHHLNKKTLLEILNVDEVSEGDVYFIPTGRIHAIGGGVLLAEIQQTSDITYRVYDWDRQDDEGNYRELHTDLAQDAIDFKALESYKTNYRVENNKASQIVTCPYFTTNILAITADSLCIDNSTKDSFVIYMCVKGEVIFTYDKEEMHISYGETILVPAVIEEFTIQTTTQSELLEVFIQ